MNCCSIYCAISMVFIIGMVYMSFSVDKSSVVNEFMETLDPGQKAKYLEIKSKRLNIYFSGYILGFVLSLIVILLHIYKKIKFTPLSLLCTTGGITFLTTYFYYILSPKGEYMVSYLFKKEQREKWIEVYRTMQFNYHFGLVLGILGVFGFSYAFC